MKIQIWSDFQCPFCYMGEKKLEEAIASVELTEPIEIEYRAYQLDPEAPAIPTETMLQHFMSGHEVSREMAEKRMADITCMAAKVGLKYNLEGVKICTTLPAHRLMKWAAKKLMPGKLKKLNFALFKANFEENLLLSDFNVLADIAAGVGINREETLEFLNSDALAKEVMHDQEEIDAREDFEFVPYMEAPDHLVVQGVVRESQLREWLTAAMAGNHEATSLKGDGCGPEGCKI